MQPSDIHNVHPCLASPKPFLLELIWLLKVLPDWKVDHWRTMFSAQVWQCEFASRNPQWKEKTDSESVLWLLHVSKARVHPYPHTDIMHAKIIMILNMLTNLQAFGVSFLVAFVKLTPKLNLTFVISIFNFNSSKFSEIQSAAVMLSFQC